MDKCLISVKPALSAKLCASQRFLSVWVGNTLIFVRLSSILVKTYTYVALLIYRCALFRCSAFSPVNLTL